MKECAVVDQRLARQIQFIVEIDQLKSVLRRTTIMDGTRRENSAEHSWHLALMAMVLGEHVENSIDTGTVIRMLLLHDIVEVDAGDTFCYDQEGVLSQAEREHKAAQRVFGLLPNEQARELRDLWYEFETGESAEARFAVALDRLQPLLCNMQSNGGSWAKYGIDADQARARMAPIARSSAQLAELARTLIDEAITRGFLQDPEKA
jgi:putative hydrolase of HD superfamily